ncbi:hypothetical protein HERIO_2259 [Hepatospora eriocheir]|uniref:MI domain-containing protein n=1 Tax=Hepatospora eriocheir TaxID=1081669 RepID=A0A1X0Q7J7_9MICR|nr:hypothetical protein HERIO_2259 [Hepatospora eriocheir]
METFLLLNILKVITASNKEVNQEKDDNSNPNLRIKPRGSFRNSLRRGFRNSLRRGFRNSFRPKKSRIIKLNEDFKFSLIEGLEKYKNYVFKYINQLFNEEYKLNNDKENPIENLKSKIFQLKNENIFKNIKKLYEKVIPKDGNNENMNLYKFLLDIQDKDETVMFSITNLELFLLLNTFEDYPKVGYFIIEIMKDVCDKKGFSMIKKSSDGLDLDEINLNLLRLIFKSLLSEIVNFNNETGNKAFNYNYTDEKKNFSKNSDLKNLLIDFIDNRIFELLDSDKDGTKIENLDQV